MRAPRCFGSAAIVVNVSAAVLNREVVDGRLVLERDGADRGRQGEDDVVVGNREQLRLPFFKPSPGGGRLTLRTMPISAGVVSDLDVVALLAARDMAAERRRAAALDR